MTRLVVGKTAALLMLLGHGAAFLLILWLNAMSYIRPPWNIHTLRHAAIILIVVLVGYIPFHYYLKEVVFSALANRMGLTDADLNQQTSRLPARAFTLLFLSALGYWLVTGYVMMAYHMKWHWITPENGQWKALSYRGGPDWVVGEAEAVENLWGVVRAWTQPVLAVPPACSWYFCAVYLAARAKLRAARQRAEVHLTSVDSC